MPGLWMPAALPGLCVSQAAIPRPGTEPGRTIPTPCPCAALWEIQEYHQNQKSGAFNSVLGVDQVEGAGNVQNVPAVVLAPGWDVWGRLSALCGMAGKAGTFQCFCQPCQVPALPQPGCSPQHHSLTLSACCVPQCCLHFHALLLYSTNRESFLLRQQSVQSYQNDPKQNPLRTIKRNSGCTKQVYTVNSVVWVTYQPRSTSTLCALLPKGIRKHSKHLSLTLRG